MANRDFSKPFAAATAEAAFPGVLTRGAKGIGVKRVQEWLTFHGFATGIDEDFGPATERAVRAFQLAHRGHVGQDGGVGMVTWGLLTAPLQRAMAPLDPAGKTLNEMVVEYAKQHLVEKPVEIGGPNDGPWVRSYMLGNGGKIWQWCAGFSTFILAMACAAKGVPLPFKPSFGVPELARAAKAKGRFLADGPPVPGDVFVIPTATGSWSHTGVVLAYDGGPKFTSAEGNTNVEGSADGTVARSVQRTVARCDFLRVGP